jgi:clan AA aspartic protease
MTEGIVQNLQATIPVTFQLPGKPAFTLEFVVDTGFAGALTLPLEAVLALELPFLQEMVANLADDNSVPADVHVGTIQWQGVVCTVAVLALGRRPLLGTALLAGMDLTVRFQEGGSITIAPVMDENNV